jgi:long-chain fatty acid transport protein
MKHKHENLGRACASLAVVAALGMAPALAGAAGFALIEQNASGMGNAYAGAAAVAEDASTIFFNPAGMGLLPGAQVAIAGHAVSVNADFSNTGCTFSPAGGCALPQGSGGVLPVGATSDNAGDTMFIPNAYFALPIGERFVFGIGLNAPFGLKTEYEDPWVGRFQGIKSELTTYNVNPAVSFKVSEAVILGLGVNYQHADAELTNAVLLAPGVEGRAKVDADDDAWGWNVGALFKLGDDMRLGVSYRSKIDYTLEGTTTVTNAAGQTVGAVSGDTQIDVTFPDMASLSVVQDFGPKWQLLGDVTWTHWSEIKTLTAINPNAAAGANIRDRLAFNFDDAWRISLGLNYRSSERWLWRGGIAWDQSPVPDAQSRTVRLPDEDRYWLALGAKWNATKRLALDIGYAHLFIDNPEVDFTRSQLSPTGSGAPSPGTSTTVRGEYDSSVDILSLQLTYTF